MRPKVANRRREALMRRNTPGILRLAGPAKRVPSPEKRQALAAAASEFMAMTVKPSITFGVGPSRYLDDVPAGRMKSKIGGIPYWPTTKTWPKTADGQDLIMLAQINFDEMPRLEGFPETGILQFFCLTSEWYTDKEDCFRTIYHRNPTLDIPQRTVVPRETCRDVKWDDYPPFKGVMYITTRHIEKMAMPISCDRFDDIMGPLLLKYLGPDCPRRVWQLPTEEYKFICECLHEERAWGHRIGGYPNFTQNDMTDDHYNTLLLQIDSDKDIMWGDCGIANTFINDRALAARNFTDVLYTWDCY